MGTNFYWAMPERQSFTLPTGDVIEAGFSDYCDDARIHIGKRSAAGLYCWNCRITLCVGGETEIHMGRSDWLEVCPKCGQSKADVDGLRQGPAAVELGFAKPEVVPPTGVRGCASFSWAQDPERVKRICEQRLEEELIVDEYGRRLTCNQFLQMLAANCPVQFTDHIGREFS